jgi:hypothetical protein
MKILIPIEEYQNQAIVGMNLHEYVQELAFMGGSLNMNAQRFLCSTGF